MRVFVLRLCVRIFVLMCILHYFLSYCGVCGVLSPALSIVNKKIMFNEMFWTCFYYINACLYFSLMMFYNACLAFGVVNSLLLFCTDLKST